MKIRSVAVSTFMAPAAATLQLPERGLVLLTGPNGSGKSRFIEACAYAAGGKTLRGSTPWRSGEAGLVILESYDGWDIKRSITAKGTKKTLVGEASADTNTKTNGWIDLDLDLWRRTHVLSSADAGHFSIATDAQRKDMIEQMLGLSLFDRAYATCAEDQSSLRDELARATAMLGEARLELRQAEQRLAEWRAPEPFEPEPAPEEAPEPDLVELGAWRAELESIRLSQRGVHERLAVHAPSDLLEKRYWLQAELEQAHMRGLVAASGECPTCGTRLGEGSAFAHQDHEGDLKQQLDQLNATIREQTKAATRASERARAELGQLDERWGLLQRQVAQAEAQLAQRERWQELQERWVHRHEARLRSHAELAERELARRARLELVRAEYADQATDAEALCGALGQQGLELGEAAKALRGLRGVVLGRALGGIEAVANGWLSQVGNRCQVRLKPYTDNKTGGTSDKLSLEIEGYGGGEGYKACSSGERRRVDTAVLLALAEVAGAAAGRSDGTIWLDEVLDALDAEGRALVAQALADLANTRCIVLITHMEDLAAQLPAVARYRVEPGGALVRL